MRCKTVDSPPASPRLCVLFGVCNAPVSFTWLASSWSVPLRKPLREEQAAGRPPLASIGGRTGTCGLCTRRLCPIRAQRGARCTRVCRRQVPRPPRGLLSLCAARGGLLLAARRPCQADRAECKESCLSRRALATVYAPSISAPPPLAALHCRPQRVVGDALSAGPPTQPLNPVSTATASPSTSEAASALHSPAGESRGPLRDPRMSLT
jgi:hypothetical protein